MFSKQAKVLTVCQSRNLENTEGNIVSQLSSSFSSDDFIFLKPNFFCWVKWLLNLC